MEEGSNWKKEDAADLKFEASFLQFQKVPATSAIHPSLPCCFSVAEPNVLEAWETHRLGTSSCQPRGQSVLDSFLWGWRPGAVVPLEAAAALQTQPRLSAADPPPKILHSACVPRFWSSKIHATLVKTGFAAK